MSRKNNNKKQQNKQQPPDPPQQKRLTPRQRQYALQAVILANAAAQGQLGGVYAAAHK